jgi:hypothetical protein
MARRTKDVSGYVDFPVNDKSFNNTKEGGMFVVLVVENDSKKRFAECCGVPNISIWWNESYLRDDNREPPKPISDEEEVTVDTWNQKEQAIQQYDEFHFPNLYRKEPEEDKELDSMQITFNKWITLDAGSRELQKYSLDLVNQLRYWKHQNPLKYVSKEFVSAITLGTTGWTGWDIANRKYWHCTYDSLTEKGKNLYNTIKDLYPGHTVRLMTWLDT